MKIRLCKTGLVAAALALACIAMADVVIRPEDGWTPVDGVRDIEAGSALDFSFLVDAPAGRYGRAKVVGENFEFENRPGIPQRFRGVNLHNRVSRNRETRKAESQTAPKRSPGQTDIPGHPHGSEP